jgi:hypothetical protein
VTVHVSSQLQCPPARGYLAKLRWQYQISRCTEGECKLTVVFKFVGGVQNAEGGHPYSRRSGQKMPISGEATHLVEDNHNKNNSSSPTLRSCDEFLPLPHEKEALLRSFKRNADQQANDGQSYG